MWQPIVGVAHFVAELVLGILVILGFVGIVTFGVIHWQQNRSNPTSQQQSHGSESIRAGDTQAGSYSYLDSKENTEEYAIAPNTDPPDKESQLAYIQSLSKFFDAAATLRRGIESGIELSDFIGRTMRLSQAYQDIHVSPEIQVRLDIDLSNQANQYHPADNAMAPEDASASESGRRNIPHGDEAGYQLYKTAQMIKEQAYAVAQQWNTKKKVSLQTAEIATVSHPDTSPHDVTQLQCLLQQIIIFETK